VSQERGLEYGRVNDVTVSDNREHCSKLISINKHGTLLGISHISFHTTYILCTTTAYRVTLKKFYFHDYLSMILSMSEGLFSYLPCKMDMVFYQGL